MNWLECVGALAIVVFVVGVVIAFMKTFEELEVLHARSKDFYDEHRDLWERIRKLEGGTEKD